MPSRYAQDARRLKGEILARVLAGESQRAICASAGMPCTAAVRTWAKADPLFAGDLLDARRRGAWMRLYAYDEGHAEAFLARARAGEPIRELLGAPGMPSGATYRYWKATQAPFAEALFALRRRWKAGVGEMGRARRRDFDQGVADRVILALHKAPPGVRLEDALAADPALPCRPTLTRWRREEPMFDAVLRMIFAGRRAAGPRVHELLVEDIVDHIVEGARWRATAARRAGRRGGRCGAGIGRTRGSHARWTRPVSGGRRCWISNCGWRRSGSRRGRSGR